VLIGEIGVVESSTTIVKKQPRNLNEPISKFKSKAKRKMLSMNPTVVLSRLPEEKILASPPRKKQVICENGKK